MIRPSRDRSMLWTMIVACFTAALACAGARAVDRAAAGVLRDREGYLIVRVMAPEGEDGLHRAAAVLIGAPEVAEAQVMTQSRAAQLLEDWSGSTVRSAELPPLRLIEVTLSPDAPASGRTQRSLVQQLADAGVLAEAIGPPDDNGRANEAMRLRQASLWAAIGISIVMALIVALAARAVATRRRDLLTVMADLGAERGEAVLGVSDEGGAIGFVAGAAGALAAAIAAIAFVHMAYPDHAPRALLRLLAPADVAPLIAAPIVAAMAAALGARLAADAHFMRAARLG